MCCTLSCSLRNQIERLLPQRTKCTGVNQTEHLVQQRQTKSTGLIPRDCLLSWTMTARTILPDLSQIPQRLIDWLIKLCFSMVKILTQRLTHVSAIATVLLITKTFIVKYYDRRI